MWHQAPECRLYYESAGSGLQPMVMLHGTTGRWDSFLPIIPALSMNHQLWIPDLRGHGRSSHVAGNYRILDFARDICHLVDMLCKNPAILFGHSLGGLVAIGVAAQRPDLVSALIIEDAPLWLRRYTVRDGSPRAYQFFRDLYELALEGQEETRLRERLPIAAPDAIAREDSTLASRLAQLDPDVLRMSYDNSLMTGFDIDRSLAKIQCPTLILKASNEQSGTLPDEDVHAALKHLADGSHRVVAGTGHHIHGDQPQQTADLIQDWLVDEVPL